MAALEPRNRSQTRIEADRALVAGFLWLRWTQMLAYVTSSFLERRGKGRRLARVVAIAWLLETSWLTARWLYRRSPNDPTAIWIDTGSAVAGLVGHAMSVRGITHSNRAIGVALSTAVAAAALPTPRQRAAAITLLAGTDALAWSIADVPDVTHSMRAVNASFHLSFFGVARALRNRTLRSAAEIEQLTARELRDTQERVRLEERNRFNAEYNRGALQALTEIREALTTDPRSAVEQARREAARLRAALRAETKQGRPTNTLTTALEMVGDQLARRSLRAVVVPDEGSDVPGSVTEMVCDAIHRLLLDVADHSGAEKAIVRVARDGATLKVSVRDHGRDLVSGREMPRFTPVKELVTRQGGEIDVWSEAGRGLRVTITLPV